MNNMNKNENFYRLVEMGEDNEYVAIIECGVMVTPLSKWCYDDANAYSRAGERDGVYTPSQRLVELRRGSMAAYAIECRDWYGGINSGYEISYLLEMDNLRVMPELSGYASAENEK